MMPAWAFSAAPTLTSISPSSGREGTSVTVSLTGSNFLPGATVSLSDPYMTVSNVQVPSSTQITAIFTITPDSVAFADSGPYCCDVTVTTSGGSATLPLAFSPIAVPPILSSISPNSSTQGLTVSVTLTGNYFDTVQGETSLIFSNPGISVVPFSLNVISAYQATATLSIAASASPG